MYKVPDVSMWINFDQISSVEIGPHPYGECRMLWIFMASGQPIKMCGDWLIDHFMNVFLEYKNE
jgi:hypothetical protein